MSQMRLIVGKNFENEELGVSLTTYIDQSDEIWVAVREVALAMGYTDPPSAIRRHVDIEDKIEISHHREVGETPTLPNHHPMKKLINESGIYSLALRSKLPRAKKFRRWITGEVLPSIRKSGYYAVPEALVVIRTIEHDNVKELEGRVRKDFRSESKTVSDLAKNPKAVEAGRLGAKKFWKNYRAMEDRLEFLEELTESLETSKRFLEIENRRLKACLERLSDELDNSEAEEVGGWMSDNEGLPVSGTPPPTPSKGGETPPFVRPLRR